MERVPKKKSARPLSKPRLLLLLLCLGALLGAGAYFLRPSPQAPALPPAAEPLYLLHRPAEEILSISIAPREGGAYTLARGENGFSLAGLESEALRDWVMEDLASIVSSLPAEDVAADPAEGHAVELGDFGLEPPWVTVSVAYRDGEQTRLRFGDLTPDDSPKRYCMMDGDARVFTVMSEESQVFFYEKDFLRAFDQPELDGALLDRIDVSGQLSFGARYTPSGWQMDAPFSYPLAPARTDQLLRQIGAMAFEALLGEARALNLSDYGLDAPALTVTLTQAPTVLTAETAAGTVGIPVPERTYTLLLGAETGKSGVYLCWEDQVYKASNFLLGFWKELTVDSLLLRQPVNLLVNDLSGVSFQCGDVSAAYEVRMVEGLTANNQIAVDEYGNTLYDCAVRRAGEQTDMDAEAFLDWYIRLASLAPAGELPPGYAPQGECLARIVLTNAHLTRVIEFFPWDALHDAIAVDGVALYYVEHAWLDRVLNVP